jgi:hypothetical protein
MCVRRAEIERGGAPGENKEKRKRKGYVFVQVCKLMDQTYDTRL